MLLWLSTVLLRFHYFVDLIGGIMVAVLGLVVAVRFEKRERDRAL